eukprot:m.493852 g.493852  ORF g.493852 m.493852 type:complete len:57 (+) comp38443_c0_seq1:293-463(+)
MRCGTWDAVSRQLPCLVNTTGFVVTASLVGGTSNVTADNVASAETKWFVAGAVWPP